MTHNHHPLPETLISYMSGTLPDAISCVVDCHVSICRDCAGYTSWLAILGGRMLKSIEAAPADLALMERAAALWSEERLRLPEPQYMPAQEIYDPLVPQPLAYYLGMTSDDIPWDRVDKGVHQYCVRLPKGSGQMRLLRLAPGKYLVEHTHTGMELTLVLQGVYGDHTGDYIRGDLVEWVEDTMHQPRAVGEQECICLIASERSPHFTRLVGRLIRPVTRF